MSLSTHFYSFTQRSTSFIKLDLKSRFHQLESSLVSHFIKTFEIKKKKNNKKGYSLFWGIFSSGRTTVYPQRNFSRHKEI